MFIVRAYFVVTEAAQLAYSSLLYAGIPQARISFRSRYKPTSNHKTKNRKRHSFVPYYVHPIRVDALVYSHVLEQAQHIGTCLRHLGGQRIRIWHTDATGINKVAQYPT